MYDTAIQAAGCAYLAHNNRVSLSASISGVTLS